MFDTCYMCDNPKTTKEHVPAKCFFPSTKRKGLIKVPSCDSHNKEKSVNDSLIRNILALLVEPVDHDKLELIEKSIPQIRRNKKFMHKIIKESIPINYNNEDTIAIPVNRKNIDNYLSSISYGLYWNDFRQKFNGNWFIIFKNRIFPPDSPEYDLLKKIPYFQHYLKLNRTAYPNIFKYYRYIEHNLIVYKIELYDLLVFYTISFDYKASNS